jgi:hypothetical protein
MHHQLLRAAGFKPHFSIGSAVVDQPSFVTVTTYRLQSGAAPGTKWTSKSARFGLRWRGQMKTPLSGVLATAVWIAMPALR